MMRPSSQRALTLVELLVVLTILVALTVVAVQSTESRLQQSRFEAGQRGLGEVETAVLGPANAREPDGTRRIEGFVADLGRLPQALDHDADAMTPLQPSELWSNPLSLEPFAVKTAALDPSVFVGAGWRGPYLRLSVGASELVDGWNEPYELVEPDGLTVATDVGDLVGQIRTLGVDEAPGGTGYALDLSATFVDINAGTLRVDATVSGTVSFDDGSAGAPVQPVDTNGPIIVVLYGPDPNTGGIAITSERFEWDPVAVPAPTWVRQSDLSQTLSFELPTTVGPRVLRAYQANGPNFGVVAPNNLSSALNPPGGFVGFTSAVRKVVVSAGGLSQDVILR